MKLEKAIKPAHRMTYNIDEILKVMGIKPFAMELSKKKFSQNLASTTGNNPNRKLNEDLQEDILRKIDTIMIRLNDIAMKYHHRLLNQEACLQEIRIVRAQLNCLLLKDRNLFTSFFYRELGNYLNHFERNFKKFAHQQESQLKNAKAKAPENKIALIELTEANGKQQTSASSDQAPLCKTIMDIICSSICLSPLSLAMAGLQILKALFTKPALMQPDQNNSHMLDNAKPVNHLNPTSKAEVYNSSTPVKAISWRDPVADIHFIPA